MSFFFRNGHLSYIRFFIHSFVPQSGPLDLLIIQPGMHDGKERLSRVKNMALGGVVSLQEVFLSFVVILLTWFILKVLITRFSQKG